MAEKHTANHGLPATTGYGITSDAAGRTVTVYCGRCRDEFAADADWARRYLEARTRALDRAAADPGPYGISGPRRDELLADERRSLAGLLP